MGNSEKPELPYRDDFYYRDACGEEILHDLRPLVRNFLKEVWAKDFLFDDKKRVNYALRLALESHKEQLRRERRSPYVEGCELPYVVHPIEAAFRALREGHSASFLVWLLLHDTLEDTWIRFHDKKFVRELFRGEVTELIVRKLSRFRLVEDQKTGEKKSVKISDKEYADQLRSSYSAVKAKHYDTLANLCSDGRRLDECLEIYPDKARKIIADIKKFIAQTQEFLLPIESDFYKELKKETEELTLKLETRLQVAETFLLQNPAGNL